MFQCCEANTNLSMKHTPFIPLEYKFQHVVFNNSKMEDCTEAQFQDLLGTVISKDSDLIEIITSMKSLRTLVGQQSDYYQKAILVEENSILIASQKIIDAYNEEKDKISVQEICILWQFLHNLCVGQSSFCQKIWLHFESTIFTLLDSEVDAKLKNVLSAIILQMIKNDGSFSSSLQMTNKIAKLLLEVIVNDQDGVLQFPLLVIQELLRNQTEFSVESTYGNLDIRQRFALLDIIAEEKPESLDNRYLQFLVNTFKSQSTILMTVLKREEFAEPREVSKVLGILGNFSHVSECMPLLQNDKSLLIDAVYLLRMVHDVGKEKVNLFAPVKNMTEIADREKMESDPVFGFKRDLIRLIGNLCHKHKENQDQVSFMHIA